MSWLTCDMTCKPARQFMALALSALMVSLVGCSSAPPFNSTGGGGGGGGTGNVANISVDGGPEAGTQFSYGNGAFTSVTICVPGSTTQCQTIGGILVDTGSYGLRIEAQALTLNLPQQTQGGSPIVECGLFGSGFTWGPVQTVDMTIAGEKASSMPIQVMGSANFPDADAPGFCTDNGAEVGTTADLNSVQSLGANGILGIGNFAADCGTACTQSGASNPGTYNSCPTASTCVTANEPVASQVVNPVSLFATDNNGVIVELPGVQNGEAATVNGSLIFGIGTETNNGLGNATIYDVDTTYGNLTTAFDGTTYTDVAFLDSGSEALFFLDSSVTGLPQCTDDILYCPPGNVNLAGTIEGFSNGNSGTVNFTVGNGDNLISGSDNAISIIGGLGVDTVDNSLYFDWGLPFFYGTNVYVAIDGATTPGGAGPYVAY
jgi:hypothetical protein